MGKQRRVILWDQQTMMMQRALQDYTHTRIPMQAAIDRQDRFNLYPSLLLHCLLHIVSERIAYW